jgi:glycosyltransferase involved in cell wall biosynthesis
MWPHEGNPANGAFVSAQAESLQKAGVELTVLALTGRRRKLAYARGIFQLRQALCGNAVDIIHAHYSYAGLVARTQWSVPVVVTFHGDDLLGTVGPNGSLTRMSKINVALSKALARVVDGAIVVNSEMVRRLGRVSSHIIPCEVDLQMYRPVDKNEARRQLGLSAGRKYLLFAANPRIPVKHFSLAEAVARELAREDPEVELLTVFREPQSRLCLYLNACDALVFPSHQEGSPTMIKQAMACNLPIAATDVGDVRQVIGSTQDCYICEPSVDAFAAALRRILQSGRRTTGRDTVAHLDGPVIARKLIEVYKSVVKGPGLAATSGRASKP